MRKIVVALLSATYLCVALTLATLLWRSGAGWGAALAGMVGALGLAFALHATSTRSLDRAALSSDIRKLREANLILLRQMEEMQDAIGGMGENVGAEAVRRSDELSSEVRMLEDLVQRLSDNMDVRLGDQRQPARHAPTPTPVAANGPAPYPLHGRNDNQATALLGEIRSALQGNRVDLYLQPVVALPQRRTVFYESFSRLRDESGRVMMPAEYLTVAEPEGLVSAIDNLLLFRCAQIVRRLARQDRKVGIFCNVSLASLRDETFFPQFLEFLSENKDMAGSLIFELGQAAFKQRGSAEARNMAKLADLGFRFSLDKVTDLDLDFPDLSRADVKFLKVGADVLLQQLLEVGGRMTMKSMRDIQASDFAAMTRRYGVEVIAEKIEAERQVVDVLELDIGYGQGHLFGEPRAIREQILAEADPPADFMRSTLRRRASGW